MDRKSRTSRSASLEDEELSLWKEICTSLVKLENIQRDAVDVITNINKVHGSSPFDNGISSALHQRLKDYYRSGISLSTSELKTIKDIIEKVSVLIALRNASEYSNDNKRKKRRHETEEKAANGSSAKKSKTGGQQVGIGVSVAAKLPTDTKDARNEEWILATTVAFHADVNRYEVEDVEQDELGKKPRYRLSARQLIPIPSKADVRHEMPAGKHVLALYPGTTCFYKAVIVSPPSKNKDINEGGVYKVQFEDDNDEFKYAVPTNVLEMPKQK
ncbi:SGF29 tudor-like domain-containing protein [Gongronella butleri]|nr:SGF29 tudor-like domain-containing protein [Gongronella butleri]